MQADRRTFLKVASAGLVSATVPAGVGHAAALGGNAEGAGAPQPSSLVEYVNIMQGTNSTGLFSRGNTLPIAAMPFGMAHWTLESAERGQWFFHPEDRRLLGIRSTHQLSPWLGDYGQATFLPFQGEIDAGASSRGASYRPERSELKPHALRIRLERYVCDLEVVPTMRGALMQATFDHLEGGDASLAIDLPGKTSSATWDKATGTVTCVATASAGGTPDNFKTWYIVQVGEGSGTDVTGLEVKAVNDGTLAVVRYKAMAGKPVSIRIGSSFISAEQGARNLAQEIGAQTLEALKAKAKDAWEKHLGRAVIEGGTLEQRRTFYSALYRTLLFPRTFHEIDANGKDIHYSAYNGRTEPGVMYADHGYWDVYRAWYPMMSILFEDRLAEILQAWVNASKEGGWLPQFPAPGYRACMTGSLIDAVFGDAAAKGLTGYDVKSAYAALKKHATMPGDPDKGYGRQGIEEYLKLGYCPADKVDQSAAETVDAAYGDFCIAQVAKAAGEEKDAALFLERSKNWQHLYDPQVQFLRGKNADGQWLTPFDPVQWGNPYVEGSAWQHRWDVPHDPQELIRKMGGNAYVVGQLEMMCTMPAAFKVGVYGKEIHEMSEMAAVDFGQYAHSNQPVHHVLYLFAQAGRPDRTQYWVRKVLNELYSPDNFAGDEDTGAMAAWYVLSSCGFYPFCPGKAEYVLGSPLFDGVTLTSERGKVIRVRAKGNSAENVYVQKVQVNGQEQAGVVLSHQVLTSGATIEFTMGARPKIG